MKTYHIKDLLKKDLLIIELPEDKDIDFYEHGRELLLLTKGYIQLGKPDEIREEDVKELVETFDLSYYVNYNHPTRGAYTLTATESLLSAIESKIYWVNPYKIYDLSTWHDVSKEYDAAELRTFDRSRSIILIKN